jgi:outer membrane protein OmpA-like peptidoglycan-associated protein
VRIDLRDTVILTHGQTEVSHYPEILLGLSYGFGKPAPAPAAPVPEPVAVDSDADGVADSADACPTQAAATVNGCPIPDTDADGVLDPNDRCPAQAGSTPDGCPNPDPDADGIPVGTDQCPEVAGIAPDGCPDPDPDHDGVAKQDDRCPDQAETKNGFEDTDGCPDEVPEQVKRFTGVIAGIEFDFGKSTIRKSSFTQLDAAVAVLQSYPALRMLVTGHTDSIGAHDANVTRSEERARAVKEYFVAHGIDASRVEIKGAGPDEPIADNATAAGQQKNRRIEFKLIQ